MVRGPLVFAQQDDCFAVAGFGPDDGDRTTDPFDMRGDVFRVSGEVRTFESQVQSGVNITPVDENGTPASAIPVFEERSFEQGVREGPGTFTLEIKTLGEVEYTVTVEDCGPSPRGDPGEEGGPTDEGGDSTIPDTSRTPARPSSTPDGTLLDAGGPSSGPVPLMPDGECPKEFPVKKGAACH
ncbi:MAG: hypothetical protein ACRDSJ_08970 [Rubrobacteraceae bacterium]